MSASYMSIIRISHLLSIFAWITLSIGTLETRLQKHNVEFLTHGNLNVGLYVHRYGVQFLCIQQLTYSNMVKVINLYLMNPCEIHSIGTIFDCIETAFDKTMQTIPFKALLFSHYLNTHGCNTGCDSRSRQSAQELRQLEARRCLGSEYTRN